MNKLFLTLILTVLCAAGAAAQESDFFRAVDGRWQGTLEYSDYSSGERVTMKTLIAFKTSADGTSAQVRTIYDDFGKIYTSSDTRRVDAAAKKFYDGETEFAIESAENGKIVLLGKTRDGAKDEPTRKTIVLTNDSLTILKETRAPWTFRHVYTLKRDAARREPPVILAPDQLRKDFDVLKASLVALHPGLYRYNTPASLEKAFAETAAKLGRPMPESEFLILVSQLVEKIRCGHTYANFYNQDAQLKERLFNRRNYLPFYFRIVDGKFILTANASSKKIAAGSEITKINGAAVAEIIAKLLTVTKADGNSTRAHRLDSLQLTRGEAEKYALFDWFFPLFFPFDDDIFTIEAVDFTTKKPTAFQVLAMTKTERTAEMAKRYGPSPTYDDDWKFEIQDGSPGFLKIGNSITWRLKTIKFKEFLANAFAELRAKKIKNLIIDVRGNGGGDMDVGFELSRYLTPRALPLYAASRRLVRNVAAQPELASYLETYSSELKEILKTGVPAARFTKIDDRYFEITGRENYPSVEPYENHFRGRAFVISDASNASATFQFLDYVKTNRLAVIVGQTTGGNRQGINGGKYFFLSLPVSRIEIDIPVYFQSPLRSQPDESVMPDVPVKKQPADLGNNLDRELSVIKELIRKSPF